MVLATNGTSTTRLPSSNLLAAPRSELGGNTLFAPS